MLAAAAPIQPLAWEPPYATPVALKKKREKERNAGDRGNARARVEEGSCCCGSMVNKAD